MRSIIKYPGSKWSIADWIIGYIPKHHTYLEPFFGSGAVLFNKERSDIETVNDLDGDIVNLFSWIRNDPERLAREIYYTPYSRRVYEEAIRNEEEESLNRALQFCIRCNMGHGYRTNGHKVGWKVDVQGREKAYAANDWRTLPERLIEAADRLRGVQIEQMAAVDLIRRYNFKDVLIYCDPPYLLETRGRRQYRYELEREQHEELLACLLEHKGPVLISGYESEFYNESLAGWEKVHKSVTAQGGLKREEVLWMNFEEKRFSQPSFFDLSVDIGCCK